MVFYSEMRTHRGTIHHKQVLFQYVLNKNDDSMHLDQKTDGNAKLVPR